MSTKSLNAIKPLEPNSDELYAYMKKCTTTTATSKLSAEQIVSQHIIKIQQNNRNLFYQMKATATKGK